MYNGKATFQSRLVLFHEHTLARDTYFQTPPVPAGLGSMLPFLLQSHYMIIVMKCQWLNVIISCLLFEIKWLLWGIIDFNKSCAVSRAGESRSRSGLIISHCEGSLIKGNGWSGNFECVFSVVFSASLGDSNSRTDAETIRASRRMFLLLLFHPSTNLLIAHQSCQQSVKVEFIVWLLKAVVSFLRSQGLLAATQA